MPVDRLGAVAPEDLQETAAADGAGADHRLDVLQVRSSRTFARTSASTSRRGTPRWSRRSGGTGGSAALRELQWVVAAERPCRRCRRCAPCSPSTPRARPRRRRDVDPDVGELVAAGEDVVVQEDVAVVHVVAERLDDRLQRRPGAERDDRRELGLGERRPERSNTTVTRSPISLKIGERDERMRTVAISCDTATTRRCSTEARMGSAVWDTGTARGRGSRAGPWRPPRRRRA